MTSRQKRAIPLYAALVLIVLCTTFIVSRYGPVSALSVNMVRPPSPEMIELVVKEAEEYIRKERYNQAAGVLRRLLVDAPQHVHAQLLMSICFYALDHLELAERSCRKLLGKYPENARLLNNLGEILVRKGELQEGIRCLSRAAQLAPDIPLIQQNLGSALFFCGEFELAFKYHNYSRFIVKHGLGKTQPYMISNAVPGFGAGVSE